MEHAGREPGKSSLLLFTSGAHNDTNTKPLAQAGGKVPQSLSVDAVIAAGEETARAQSNRLLIHRASTLLLDLVYCVFLYVPL